MWTRSRAISGVSPSTILELKAIVLEEESKLAGGVAPSSSLRKSVDVFSRSNVGIKERQRKDLEQVASERRTASNVRLRLEEKSEQYERLSRGELPAVESSLVDFARKRSSEWDYAYGEDEAALELQKRDFWGAARRRLSASGTEKNVGERGDRAGPEPPKFATGANALPTAPKRGVRPKNAPELSIHPSWLKQVGREGDEEMLKRAVDAELGMDDDELVAAAFTERQRTWTEDELHLIALLRRETDYQKQKAHRIEEKKRAILHLG